MRKILFTIFIFGSLLTSAQLKSGPMLGHITSMEAKIWLQLEKEGEIKIEYFEINNSEVKQEVYVKTFSSNWNTATITLSRLNPNSTYSYIIYENNTQIAEGVFKTQQLLDNTKLDTVKFATGSCAYLNEKKMDRKGEPFGRNFSIFNEIELKQPDFMLWLGDNIYLRNREWNSKTGIYRRYSQFKSQQILQNFWKNISHYAIWDDHDFGPNDADRSFVNKDITLEAFKDFWANPSYGINSEPGITTQFSYEDLDFFLLDNRYNRTPNDRKTGEREILGKTQIEWLIDALINSKANFKFVAVGGQFLSDAKVWENHANYEEERKLIIELIEKENIKNIVFLTGDRHKTELSELKLNNGFTLYEYTCSPLASKAFDSKNEGNNNQVEGTHVATQNFGLLEISGVNNNRVLSINTYNNKGELIWKKSITQQ